MAIKDTFTIQEINLDKKDPLYYFNQRQIEAFWNK